MTRQTQIWYSGVHIWRWDVKRVTCFSRSGLSDSMGVSTTRVGALQVKCLNIRSLRLVYFIGSCKLTEISVFRETRTHQLPWL